MIETLFDVNKVEPWRGLFDPDIENDPWVAFHGTSSVYEAEIDRLGFKILKPQFTRENVQRVVDLFDTLDWCGEHPGGFAVLKPFTMNFNFKDSDSPSIFLAESSLSATTYATHDFAGGETARALRYALNDLEKYNESPTGRKTIDVKAKELNQIRLRAFDSYNRHEYGLVYAVRFDSARLEGLDQAGSMGITSTTTIAPQMLIAKIKVPKYFEPPDIMDKRRFDREFEAGLITALKSDR